MIDTFRGVLRVRKWPKKRGPPRSPLQAWWVDWFRQANLLAKYADPMSQARAIEMTKGSGMYPRDVLLKAMRGRLYFWSTPDGWKWYSMAAVQDISESLDALAQTVGSVLVRAVDRWRSVVAGAAGQVLTYQGSAAPPTWETPSTGGGMLQVNLTGTPIVPDGTKSEYVLAVGTYAQLLISLENVGFVASSNPALDLSIDGGVSYKNGASDYFSLVLSSLTEGTGLTNRMILGALAATTSHNVILWLSSLRVGRALLGADSSQGASQVKRRAIRANFDGPVTHIKIRSGGGSNFNAGVIRVIGTLA